MKQSNAVMSSGEEAEDEELSEHADSPGISVFVFFAPAFIYTTLTSGLNPNTHSVMDIRGLI